MRELIEWQCNIYEIDETSPNNITKTLIIDKPKFAFQKLDSKVKAA